MMPMLNVCWKSPGNLLGWICGHPDNSVWRTMNVYDTFVEFILIYIVLS